MTRNSKIVKYRVRAIGCTWRATFDSLIDAKKHALNSWEFRNDPKTIIEKITTERIAI